MDLRQGFLNLTRDEPGRCILIDGNQAIEAVAEQVVKVSARVLK